MSDIDWKVAKAMCRMRRRRENHKAIRFLTKAAAVILLTGAAAMFSGANTTPTEVAHDVYIVEEGDNLWTLTEKFRERDTRDPYIYEYMDEIKKLNPELIENKGRLYPGQVLKFEYEVKKTVD